MNGQACSRFGIRSVGIATAGLALGLLLAGSAGATTFYVTVSGDTGPGTLRAALTAAQADASATAASPHVIDFSALPSPTVISLGSRITLHFTHVDLVGLGMADLVLDASGFNSTIFSVEDGSTMTLRDMTLRGATASTSGGAVALDQYTGLTALDVYFLNNSSENGGAIRAGDNSTLAVTRCVFDSNSTNNYGGAISAGGGAGNVTTIENSVFRGNVASDAGQTHGQGGGVIITDGSFEIVNSVFSGNGSVESGSGLRIGPAASGDLLNSTLSGNVSGTGGALNVRGTVNMGNTIVARNLSTDPARDVDESTPTHSLGGNLIGDNTGAATTFPAGLPNGNGDYVGTAAAPLDPLFREDVPSTLTTVSTGGTSGSPAASASTAGSTPTRRPSCRLSVAIPGSSAPASTSAPTRIRWSPSRSRPTRAIPRWPASRWSWPGASPGSRARRPER